VPAAFINGLSMALIQLAALVGTLTLVRALAFVVIAALRVVVPRGLAAATLRGGSLPVVASALVGLAGGLAGLAGLRVA
jgi:hypothetical protein